MEAAFSGSIPTGRPVAARRALLAGDRLDVAAGVGEVREGLLNRRVEQRIPEGRPPPVGHLRLSGTGEGLRHLHGLRIVPPRVNAPEQQQ